MLSVWVTIQYKINDCRPKPKLLTHPPQKNRSHKKIFVVCVCDPETKKGSSHLKRLELIPPIPRFKTKTKHPKNKKNYWSCHPRI